MTLQPGDLVAIYANGVIDGHYPAGRRVRQQCERHLRDLENGKDRGLYFNVTSASHAIRFFSYLNLWEGSGAGSSFALRPWQAFIVGSIFGWKRDDGTRRYRTAWVEVPRKNGKTPLAAGIGLYLLKPDGEAAPQVLAIATKKEQADLIFSHASIMAAGSGIAELRNLKFEQNKIKDDFMRGVFKPLARDAHTEDGLNPHGALFDEVHKYKDRKMWDVISSALGSRRQPLKLCITTAGDGADLMMIGYELHDYAEKILDGGIENDTWFCYIAGVDEGDDWKDEATWRKANPNMDVSVFMDFLRDELQMAIASPASQDSFRRNFLNEWIYRAEKAIDIEKWLAGGSEINLADLKGRPCYGGIDMSTNVDLSDFTLRFPPMADNEQWRSLYFPFLPRDILKKAEDRDRVPYRQWAEDGYLTPTPGNVIDERAIRAKVMDQAALYDIRDIGFDPWSATAMALELQDEGLQMVEMRQGMYTMAMPSKQYDTKILAGLHNHGHHPIATWSASNLMWETDSNENFRPSKKASRTRIDPIVADIMAHGRAVVHETHGPAPIEKGFIDL